MRIPSFVLRHLKQRIEFGKIKHSIQLIIIDIINFPLKTYRLGLRQVNKLGYLNIFYLVFTSVYHWFFTGLQHDFVVTITPKEVSIQRQFMLSNIYHTITGAQVIIDSHLRTYTRVW